MSNIFLKNNLKDIFDSVTESELHLPKYITIIDNATEQNNSVFVKKSNNIKGGATSGGNLSATSSELMSANSLSATSPVMLGGANASYSTTSDIFMQDNNNFSATSSAVNMIGGGNLSATSSAVNMVGGGNFSATSSVIRGGAGSLSATSSVMNIVGGANGGSILSATSSNLPTFSNKSIQNSSHTGSTAVKKLISMLTTESDKSETSTASLEQQLRNILKQDGGATSGATNHTTNNNVSINQVKGFFNNLKKQGVNVNVKLNDRTLSDFFGQINETTTELPKLVGGAGSKKSSRKSSKKSSKKSSRKSSKKSSKKSSRKSSKKSSRKSSMRGGAKKASKKSSKGGADHKEKFKMAMGLAKHIKTKYTTMKHTAAVANAWKVIKELEANNKDVTDKSLKELFDSNPGKYSN